MELTEQARERALRLLAQMRQAFIRHDMDGSYPAGRHPLGPEVSFDDLCATLHADVAELRELLADGAPRAQVDHLADLCDRLSAIDDFLGRHRTFTAEQRAQVPHLEQELLATVRSVERMLDVPTRSVRG